MKTNIKQKRYKQLQKQIKKNLVNIFEGLGYIHLGKLGKGAKKLLKADIFFRKLKV
jgi:hypothetical protein